MQFFGELPPAACCAGSSQQSVVNLPGSREQTVKPLYCGPCKHNSRPRLFELSSVSRKEVLNSPRILSASKGYYAACFQESVMNFPFALQFHKAYPLPFQIVASSKLRFFRTTTGEHHKLQPKGRISLYGVRSLKTQKKSDLHDGSFLGLHRLHS